MPKIIIISYQLIFSIVLLTSCKAQTNQIECNRSFIVESDSTKIPPYLCFPEGDYILNYKFEDFNNDKTKDLWVRHSKKNKRNGDKTTYSFYIFDLNKQKFKLIQSLNNIIPIHFEKWGSQNYTDSLQDPLLAKYYDDYHGETPLDGILIIKNNLIKIPVSVDAVSRMVFTFEFNNSKNDWLLIDLFEEVQGAKSDCYFCDRFEMGSSIKNFSFYDWYD